MVRATGGCEAPDGAGLGFQRHRLADDFPVVPGARLQNAGRQHVAPVFGNGLVSVLSGFSRRFRSVS